MRIANCQFAIVNWPAAPRCVPVSRPEHLGDRRSPERGGRTAETFGPSKCAVRRPAHSEALGYFDADGHICSPLVSREGNCELLIANSQLSIGLRRRAVFRSPDRNTSLTEGLPRSVSGSWRPAVSPGARSGDLRTAWTRCVPVSRPEHVLDLAVFRSPDRNTSLTEGLPRSVSGSWRPAVSPGARSGDLRTAWVSLGR